MAKRLFDFLCEDGHEFETFVDTECRSMNCKVCGTIAHRVVSCPSIKLDGCSGDFPGETMRWERKRAEKLAQERKRAE